MLPKIRFVYMLTIAYVHMERLDVTCISIHKSTVFIAVINDFPPCHTECNHHDGRGQL